MERINKLPLYPWLPVGTTSSWTALYDIAEKDENGNAFNGEVLDIDAYNTYVRGNKRLVATIGVQDLVVVDTADALMIARKDQSQVKRLLISSKLMIATKRKFMQSVSSGVYETIDESDRFKVKRIVVNPGSQLSLQMHHHRAEHWIVVKGSA